MKILCAGECTADHYLDLNRTYPGGISFNFAINARRCGAEAVSLISCVGQDEIGRHILNKLSKEGINRDHVRVLPGQTASQDIFLLDGGERSFPPGGFKSGTLDKFRLSQAAKVFVHQHDIIAAPLFSQVEPIYRGVMLESGFQGRRVADLLDWGDYDRDFDRLRPHLSYLDIAFLSGNETTVERVRPLAQDCPGMIVVTLGAAGSVALVNDALIHQPALPVEAPLDTTGCGDAFQAAFTVTYFHTGDIRQALAAGAEQASHVIRHYGAIN